SRRGRCRIRLCDRRPRGIVAPDGDRDPQACPARRSLRARRRQGQSQRRCGLVVRRRRAELHGPAPARSGRIRRAVSRGFGLLAAFGRCGLLGRELDALGVQVGFTQLAVVLAVTFVAGPFYLRAAISAFEAVDPSLPAAARTLGAGPGRTFLRVALPLAGGGLGAGWALSFARGIGEFGA